MKTFRGLPPASAAAGLLAACAAAALAGIAGCLSHDAAPAGGEAAAPAPPPGGPNAFETLKLSRFSREVGPVYFAHELHADLLDSNGRRISCVRCHHQWKPESGEPARGCTSCHPQQEQPYEPGRPKYT